MGKIKALTFSYNLYTKEKITLLSGCIVYIMSKDNQGSFTDHFYCTFCTPHWGINWDWNFVLLLFKDLVGWFYKETVGK